ncbi:MAG TPA: HAD family hydrolase [Candidatus Thermoplasmatota archaeon]|nr:HAD family hydrolase [Candidatus Thermoplasmatota archaeon]
MPDRPKEPRQANADDVPDAPSPAIFLDRDGVLNANRDDYVKSWSEFAWLPGTFHSLRALRAAGYALVVVTNQSMVGRGLAAAAALEDIHRRMLAELARHQASLDAIMVCTHAPDDRCACRKPEPGLVLEAARLLRVDLARSVLVGDRDSDLEAGRRAGVGRLERVGPARPLWKVAREIVASL